MNWQHRRAQRRSGSRRRASPSCRRTRRATSRPHRRPPQGRRADRVVELHGVAGDGRPGRCKRRCRHRLLQRVGRIGAIRHDGTDTDTDDGRRAPDRPRPVHRVGSVRRASSRHRQKPRHRRRPVVARRGAEVRSANADGADSPRLRTATPAGRPAARRSCRTTRWHGGTCRRRHRRQGPLRLGERRTRGCRQRARGTTSTLPWLPRRASSRDETRPSHHPPSLHPHHLLARRSDGVH